MTPAQVAALVFGAWWTLNGIVALTAGDSSFSGPAVHGEVSALGVSIAVNGWHGLFHLVSGLVGLAVFSRDGASRVYAIAVGILYLAAAGTGFIAGNAALGLMSVDTPGSIVHAIEGAVVLAAGLASRQFGGGRAPQVFADP